MNTPFPVKMLRDLANETVRQFARLDPKLQTDALKTAILGADIYIGVLPNGSTFIIKGEARLREIAGGNFQNPDRRNAIGAIQCTSAEEAEAMRQVFGDGRPSPKAHLRLVRGDE